MFPQTNTVRNLHHLLLPHFFIYLLALFLRSARMHRLSFLFSLQNLQPGRALGPGRDNQAMQMRLSLRKFKQQVRALHQALPQVQ